MQDVGLPRATPPKNNREHQKDSRRGTYTGQEEPLPGVTQQPGEGNLESV